MYSIRTHCIDKGDVSSLYPDTGLLLFKCLTLYVTAVGSLSVVSDSPVCSRSSCQLLRKKRNNLSHLAMCSGKVNSFLTYSFICGCLSLANSYVLFLNIFLPGRKGIVLTEPLPWPPSTGNSTRSAHWKSKNSL